MENKLTEKGLFSELYMMYCFYRDGSPNSSQLAYEAYNQLIKIMKEHFKRKEFTKGYEIKQIKQKPTVTTKWLRNEINAFWDITEFDDAERGRGALLYRLSTIFEKAGVEVTDK